MKEIPKTELENLKQFCLSKNRVCPMPMYWTRLYEIIVREDKDTTLPVPLILAAWSETTHLDKMVRLVEQLHYAERHGTLDEADSYLREMPLSHWFRSETSN